MSRSSSIAAIAGNMQNLDMRVHDCGFSSAGDICFHDHRTSGLHEFHYFLGGEGTFENAGVSHGISAGSLFFSRPDQSHRAWHSQVGGRFRFYYLLFHPEGDSDNLLAGIRERLSGFGVGAVGKGFAGAFEDIRRRSLSQDSLVRKSADYRLMALICDITSGGPGPETSVPRYVEEALALMQATIHDPLDLEALAGRLGIDKAYFVRLFKQAVGQPPMQYYLGLRIDTAKHRLRNGDELLRTIARDLGFRDEFHFSHQFKAHVGQSPRSYRGHLRLTHS